MNSKPVLHIVWLKRDLRLQDNEAIYNALKSNERVLLLYVFESYFLEDDHYSERHRDFVKQSLSDLNEQLIPYHSKVLVVQSEINTAINQLLQKYEIKTICSHQETGLQVTYDRDKNFKRFCKNNFIHWTENVNNGVFRGLKNRDQWEDLWESYMQQPLLEFKPQTNQLLSISEIGLLEQLFYVFDLTTSSETDFQKGGSILGSKYLKSFLNNERYIGYSANISKPLTSRYHCSRLSPYIAWGNLSIRQVWQYAFSFSHQATNKRALNAFASRLRWQAHFIQKFEMEPSMESETVNKGYAKLKKQISEAYQLAWKTGMTGIPIVDACMRCVVKTGYLNFRMRAMLVSFFTHLLWQPWQDASVHLARQFLDFEPGIHFPQLQMQAGDTGVNTIRIYNPVKNGLEHDPDGEFIKKWVPELAHLEVQYVHEPYKMTYFDQKISNFTLGINYPKPIVNIQEKQRLASKTLWGMRKDILVQQEKTRIIKTHINPTNSKQKSV